MQAVIFVGDLAYADDYVSALQDLFFAGTLSSVPCIYAASFALRDLLHLSYPQGCSAMPLQHAFIFACTSLQSQPSMHGSLGLHS